MEKKITNFELNYDGMYHINWSEGEQKHEWYVHLSLSELLKMLEIEGISFDDVLNAENSVKPLKFEKVVLKYSMENETFEAYGYHDEWLGNTLKNNYTVELFAGDSIKNHRGETILGFVELDIDDSE